MEFEQERTEETEETGKNMVRAKFKVDSIEKFMGGDGELAPEATIRLSPVYSGSKENEEFYRWTPAGQIVLATVNGQAVKQFEEGKEYYVDFTPAE